MELKKKTKKRKLQSEKTGINTRHKIYRRLTVFRIDRKNGLSGKGKNYSEDYSDNFLKLKNQETLIIVIEDSLKDFLIHRTCVTFSFKETYLINFDLTLKPTLQFL